MKIALGLGPEPGAVAAFGAQCGVKHAVGNFSLEPKPGLDIGDPEQPFSRQSLTRRMAQYEAQWVSARGDRKPSADGEDQAGTERPRR